jgi:hypothetical protein
MGVSISGNVTNTASGDISIATNNSDIKILITRFDTANRSANIKNSAGASS